MPNGNYIEGKNELLSDYNFSYAGYSVILSFGVAKNVRCHNHWFLKGLQ